MDTKIAYSSDFHLFSGETNEMVENGSQQAAQQKSHDQQYGNLKPCKY